jgi:hypothetical protein
VLCGIDGSFWTQPSCEGRRLADAVAELCDKSMDASAVAASSSSIWSGCRIYSTTGRTAGSACTCAEVNCITVCLTFCVFYLKTGGGIQWPDMAAMKQIEAEKLFLNNSSVAFRRLRNVMMIID